MCRFFPTATYTKVGLGLQSHCIGLGFDLESDCLGLSVDSRTTVLVKVARLDPGSGRVRKFTGKGGSGRVQFGQKLKFNFTLKCRGSYFVF